ncbi:MAG: hypothetical protein IPH06_10160 [Alphaproteobacteria bacterium]|jgi:hypothetical protein|nr:hypothetical protein [Alphaproteobacteria bacterium]QQS58349.1 MAG: hypothetical protein IPN28_05915 [Alphaproteobacteria bacterium]
MKIIDIRHNNIKISFSRHERTTANNALNETCNGMHISNYENVVGFTREKIRSLLINKFRPERKEPGTYFIMDFTNEEVMIIANSLNQTCIGLDVREFHTRTGAHLEEMQALLTEFSQLLVQIKN